MVSFFQLELESKEKGCTKARVLVATMIGDRLHCARAHGDVLALKDAELFHNRFLPNIFAVVPALHDIRDLLPLPDGMPSTPPRSR